MQDLITIIYSKDRAFQLEACLHSLFNFSDDKSMVAVVLYKVTSDKIRAQYETLKNEYKQVNFVEESDLVEQTISEISNYWYVLIVVDDSLFYLPFNISNIIDQLKIDESSLGFSLRLGLNTTWNYMGNRKQPMPITENVAPGILRFDWTKQEGGFGYPLEVSSSIYRVSDIKLMLSKFVGLEANPSFIESKINNQKQKFANNKPNLLCFEKSVAFSCPVNLTKVGKINPHARKFDYPVNVLEDHFEAGIRFDIKKLKEVEIIGCHQEICLI